MAVDYCGGGLGLILCWGPGFVSGCGSSALVLCGVEIFVAMVGGLWPLTVVAGVSMLCGAEVLGPPIFIMSFYLYCIVTYHIVVLCYCGL